MEPASHNFRIADHGIRITFAAGNSRNSMSLLPAMNVFRTEELEGPPLFELEVDDSTRPAEGRSRLKTFDTGNGDTTIYLLPDGGYQFIIKDIQGNNCCLLITDSRFRHGRCALNGNEGMRTFGLNDALMLLFAFAGCLNDTLLIHASCVRNGGKAFPFIAKSGTGKSTHSALWLQHIEGTDLINDDNPAVRIVNGLPVLYGTPWSGKTPCYRNVKAPLGAIVKIERAQANSMERLRPAQALAALMPASSTMKWNASLQDAICDLMARIISTTPIFTLHCLPDKEAATLCRQNVMTSESE